jgi:hypothetical protein
LELYNVVDKKSPEANLIQNAILSILIVTWAAFPMFFKVLSHNFFFNVKKLLEELNE